MRAVARITSSPCVRAGSAALVVLIVLVSPSLAGTGDSQRPAGIQPPQRFTAVHMEPALGQAHGRVRVHVALAGDPLLAAAAAPKRRFVLEGRLTRAEQGALRAGRGGAVIRRQERERHAALAELQPAARRVERRLLAVRRAIEAAGGDIVAGSPITNSLTALVPAAALDDLVRRPGVRTIAPAAVERPDGLLELTTSAVGAPSFWAAGHTGGRGASDTSAVDLAILNDKIQQDHPAFAGITFQTPSPGWGTGTPCGSSSGSCDHGTAVASVAMSRGASGCAQCVADDANAKGVAPGLDTVLDASGSGVFDSGAWSLGLDYGDHPGASDPAEVMSGSFGATASEDDSLNTQNTDKYGALGVTYTRSAGNAGPAQSVGEGCIAYNVICAGAYRHFGTADPSDDDVASFSSRGPSPGGRKKPDLVAIGVPGQYAERRWFCCGLGLWAGSLEGTSFAAPQVAGGAALLAGTGISDPLAQKAILINSARQGRATAASAMGTQTGWQPDWGWGALDLAAALAERTNFQTAAVPGGGVRFYRASVAAGGDRATLVWRRRVTGCFAPGCGGPPGSGSGQNTVMTLTNLDLEQRDAQTGALQHSSSSAIDNVEQVRASAGEAGTDVVYKVKAQTSVDGLAAEPFALASRRPLTALVNPHPTLTLTRNVTRVRRGEVFGVTATIANPSPDLTAENARITWQLPPGVELVDGYPPSHDFGTLSAASPGPGDEATISWLFYATADGTYDIRATAQAERYGETFTTERSAGGVLVDGTPPAPSIEAPAGETDQTTLEVAWSASDAGSGVASYDVDVAVDGGPYSSWLAATTTTSAAYVTSAGRSYRFRVRARDELGNVSGYAESAVVTVRAPAPPGGDPPGADPPTTEPLSSRLRLYRPRMVRGRLRVAGTIARGASGTVRITYTARAGRRTVRLRRRVAVRRGRFRATLALPTAVRTRPGRLVVRYGGDRTYAPRTLRRVVRVARR